MFSARMEMDVRKDVDVLCLEVHCPLTLMISQALLGMYTRVRDMLICMIVGDGFPLELCRVCALMVESRPLN